MLEEKLDALMSYLKEEYDGGILNIDVDSNVFDGMFAVFATRETTLRKFSEPIGLGQLPVDCMRVCTFRGTLTITKDSTKEIADIEDQIAELNARLEKLGVLT